MRSFDGSVNEAHQAFLTHLSEEYIERTAGRAFETFDFSQLAQRGRTAKEIQSLLLIKEVLDRIELPPDEEIPGDAEVEAQGLAQWTIPNTRITIAKVRQTLSSHPRVSPESLHVRFHSFGAYSLDVKVFAYIRTREWLEYLAIREDINLRVMAIVAEAGTGFAFPSQTAYLGRDSGLNVERGREAEETIQEWKSTGQFPFPEFDDGVVDKARDTLEYPPPGSPGSRSRIVSSVPS